MFVAATTFVDLQDGRRLYHEGETFPRDGLTVSEERLAELAGRDNLSRRPLIVAVPDVAKEEPVEEKPVTRKRGRSRAK